MFLVLICTGRLFIHYQWFYEYYFVMEAGIFFSSKTNIIVDNMKCHVVVCH